MMSTTDGIYRWYYGAGKEPEMYDGSELTRDAALSQAWGQYPAGDFTILEADKTRPTFDVLPAGWIIERYEECNEECWGEDGAEIHANPEQERELERALGKALKAWMDKHKKLGRVWAVGNTRNEEYFPEKIAVTIG